MMKKILFVSVTSLLLLCKPAFAEKSETDSASSDDFSVGGYASTSLSVPRDDSVELAIDDISLIVRWEGDSRFKFFGELELERPIAWGEDKRFNQKDTYFDLERLYVDYNLSEKLNLRAGRFLTPAGRWNLLHAAPLMWTSTRPLVTSRLFPASTNGLMLYGSVPMQHQAFEYTFFVETLKDQFHDPYEIRFRDVAGARFTLNNGANIGLTLMTLRETEPSSLNYRLIGLDFLTQFNRLELSGEGYYRFTEGGHDGGSGAYLQSAYQLGQDWFALARLETFQSPLEGSAARWLVGAAKQIKPNQRLKLEFVGGTGDFPDAPRGFIGSYAILF